MKVLVHAYLCDRHSGYLHSEGHKSIHPGLPITERRICDSRDNGRNCREAAAYEWSFRLETEISVKYLRLT